LDGTFHAVSPPHESEIKPAMQPPRENPHLFGHAPAEAAILQAMRRGRLHHAWLITGAEGVGKATLAFRFARALLAGQSATLEMSEQAPVFRRVAAATHADLLTVEREWDEKKKRMKKSIAADTARGIPPFLHLTPAEGGWRVVIVDGAEDLNPQSANALLKVLEEPPPRAVLILVCSAPGRLLPTIRSRCRHLALAPLAEADMMRALSLYLPSMPEADCRALLAISEGSPGRALALAEEGGLKLAGMVNEVLQAGPSIALTRAYEMSDSLREQAPFETFMALLHRGIATAVGAYVRGTADPTQRALIETRDPARWADIAQRLAQLTVETEFSNMDRRQALISGLALLKE
jgi:DNA polymerase-3 subunit delta'